MSSGSVSKKDEGFVLSLLAQFKTKKTLSPKQWYFVRLKLEQAQEKGAVPAAGQVPSPVSQSSDETDTIAVISPLRPQKP